MHNHVREDSMVVQIWGAESWARSFASPQYSLPSIKIGVFAMRPTNTLSTRRGFLQASAAAAVSAAVPSSNALAKHAPQQPKDDAFLARQKERRKELWELLGDLPWEHKPGPAKLISKEEHEDYTLERLVLDLNGEEAV